MQDVNLPHFSTSTHSRIVITPKKEIQQPQEHSAKPLEMLEDLLQGISYQNTEESAGTRTRRILGEKAQTLSDEHIQCIVTEFQHLINTWLDEYERDVFKGMTLREVLNEK